MPQRVLDKDNYFDKLETLMKVLRKECPWDNEQTLTSLRTYTLEETHEVLEAIDKAVDENDWSALQGELGDLLIQIAFYSVIADEHGAFSLGDVFESLIQKMIYRHPHVFGDARPKDVLEQWESLKDVEHKERESLMDGIPPLPALAYALKLQKRAARVGFDWKEAADVIDKMEEELSELAVEVRNGGSMQRISEEFGDLLFTIVNLGRKLDLDAEISLMTTNRKFSKRFRGMEALADQKRLDMNEMPLDELEALYNEVKVEMDKRRASK